MPLILPERPALPAFRQGGNKCRIITEVRAEVLGKEGILCSIALRGIDKGIDGREIGKQAADIGEGVNRILHHVGGSCDAVVELTSIGTGCEQADVGAVGIDTVEQAAGIEQAVIDLTVVEGEHLPGLLLCGPDLAAGQISGVRDQNRNQGKVQREDDKKDPFLKRICFLFPVTHAVPLLRSSCSKKLSAFT